MVFMDGMVLVREVWIESVTRVLSVKTILCAKYILLHD